MPPRPIESGNALVSVVIPAYNAEKWLPLTLDSVCLQTHRSIEVIVIDDGSTDRTSDIAESYAREDSRIRVIRRKNAGVGAARNTGIREAKGKYIAPIDADDLWHPRKLELQVACIEEGGDEMGFVYCWSEKIDEQGRLIAASFPFENEGWVHHSLILRNFVGSGSIPLFRASALEETGLYLEREEQGGVQGCEDWDLSLRLSEHYKVGLVRHTLAGYRQLAGCMSLDATGMSRSYECIMSRARKRAPGVPASVFNWSAGNFYSYLVAKCYLWGDYRGCLRSIVKATAADHMLIANRRFYSMGLKSIVRLVTRTRGRPPSASEDLDPDGAPSEPRPGPARRRETSWLDSVQLRRWHAALDADNLPRKT